MREKDKDEGESSIRIDGRSIYTLTEPFCKTGFWSSRFPYDSIVSCNLPKNYSSTDFIPWGALKTIFLRHGSRYYTTNLITFIELGTESLDR